MRCSRRHLDGVCLSRSVSRSALDRAGIDKCFSLLIFSITRLSIYSAIIHHIAYEGMHIPQGSLVFGNIWAIMRDPGLYEDPEVFEPGRWLARDAIVDVEERDPRAFVFGFGRRNPPRRIFSMALNNQRARHA